MAFGSALEGLRVIDLGQMIAGPLCASMLGDMGADVIKVEAPGKGDISRDSLPKQDGVSTYFIAFNRSKRGICLNLKTPEGKEILKKLIVEADVLIENFRPGVMDRLGFSYEVVHRINPQIIYASISGFGQAGEYAHRACFDPIAQAISGMMSVTGSEHGEKVRCGASIADIMAAQNAVCGILAALQYRQKSGVGQWIDVSLIDSCIVALSSMNQFYLTTGTIPAPKGNRFEASAPGNSYPTSNGILVISAGQNSEWAKLAHVLGHEEWLEDNRFSTVDLRVQNRELLDSLISAETVKFNTDMLLTLLLDIGLPAGPVQNVKQVIDDPYFSDVRNMFPCVEHPKIGTVQITNQGIKMSETNPYVRSCAPTLGQHNVEVLLSLGYSNEDIDVLTSSGVIFAEQKG